MVVSMPQWQAINDFYDGLDVYGRAQQPPWLVTALLPVRYRPNPTVSDKEQLSPDVMVAFVPIYPRSSYDVDLEGKPPAYVLEVVSPESRTRDLQVKPVRYEYIGVEEYALFAPLMTRPGRRRLLQPSLQGYRRDPHTGSFVPWERDEAGRLYSEVLGLWLVDREGKLRAQKPDGTLLLTHDESEAARLRAEAARLHAEAAREQEATVRRQLEAEVARLRAELERGEDG